MERDPSSGQLESRIVEILDAIREVLNRLATLEEKTIWHHQIMNQLNSDQRCISDKIAEHEKDRGRIALVERELQYITGDISKQSKQLEVITSVVSDLQKADSAQGKTVGFIEKAGSQFVMAIIGVAAGAVVMKLVGG